MMLSDICLTVAYIAGREERGPGRPKLRQR